MESIEKVVLAKEKESEDLFKAKQKWIAGENRRVYIKLEE